MHVRVEFFGMARLRAGISEYAVVLNQPSPTLGDVYQSLAQQLPGLVPHCIEHGHLQSGFLASINSGTFTSAADAVLHPDDVILILSTDAGG